MGDYEDRPQRPKTNAPSASKLPLPKPKLREQAGHKEASWVQPNSASSGLAHVGSIYFRTKESLIDSRDRQLLERLAGSYARFADNDKGRHSGAPIFGNVIGHADPRSSEAPDNKQLSEDRASIVATELDRAFAASPIVKTVGFQHFDHEGAGVDVGMSSDDEGLEANTLAPLRRADILVHGKANTVSSTAPAQVDTTDARPQPPDYSERVHAYDRYKHYIDIGDKPSIKAIAIDIMNISVDSDMIDHLATWSVKGVKPVWWDTRDQTPAPRLGRGGPTLKTAKQLLIDKARRMVSDYRVYAFYAIEHDGRNRARYANSAAGDPEATRILGELHFMILTIRDEANEVYKLAED